PSRTLKPRRVIDCKTISFTRQAYSKSIEDKTRVALGTTTTQKILKELAGSDFVHAERGKSGGYRLLRPASEISLVDIVEVLEGPIALTSCVTTSENTCSSRHSCFLGGNWEKINTAISHALKDVSLADLCNPDDMFPESQNLNHNIQSQSSLTPLDMEGE
ncbi:MAG: RrF2 family transcriptional regulator, partial [Candidatus Puniceispirillales bacterium]